LFDDKLKAIDGAVPIFILEFKRIFWGEFVFGKNDDTLHIASNLHEL